MVTHKCVNLEPPLGYTISNQPHNMIVQYATNACNHNISPCTKVDVVQQIDQGERERIAKSKIKLQKAN